MSRVAGVLTFGGAEEGPSRGRRLLGIAFGLIYLVYPVTDIATGEVSGPKAAWGIVALVTFVAAYVATVLSPSDYEDRTRWTLPLLAVTTVMAVIYPIFFGGGWLSLPIYVTVVYAMALPMRPAVLGITGMGVTVVVEGLLLGTDAGTLVILLLQVTTLGVLFMSVRNTRLLVVQLRQAQREVARLAAADERLRISRDLHDLLGHSLSLIVLKSELAGRLAETDSGAEPVRREIADIESVARQALVEVREAVTGYRQRALSDELDNARSTLEAAGVTVTIRRSGPPLVADLDGLFGWAVREGTTNVARHARATHCLIEVTHNTSTAILEITDDGQSEAGQPGSGLTGLSERVEASGGTLQAASLDTRGFRLRVEVPIRVADPVEIGINAP
jgi:two-component system sensor histidine kinase DesK